MQDLAEQTTRDLTDTTTKQATSIQVIDNVPPEEKVPSRMFTTVRRMHPRRRSTDIYSM